MTLNIQEIADLSSKLLEKHWLASARPGPLEEEIVQKGIDTCVTDADLEMPPAEFASRILEPGLKTLAERLPSDIVFERISVSDGSETAISEYLGVVVNATMTNDMHAPGRIMRINVLVSRA